MPIRILDAATVGRIAAGEVVERPSSVVKELMENAIDAGSTAITVEIKGGGIDYLRVTDNGCGIEPGQVRLAFENHATSKLQSAEQLDDIRTLGFRGEALPSIASVSHVEMTTRAKGQDTGVRLNIDGGKDLRVKETGCPEGTTFIMKDLFYNLPVRRAFLKKPNYEGGLVGDAVARMILGNPGVAVRYINNGNNVYHSFGDGKLRHAVFAVYGNPTAEQMVEVDASEGGTRVYGLIGVGELAKATRAHQAFFINGRSVRCPLLSRALEEVCRSRVTIGMYPMCALNLVIPPTSVNVNVHPNKLEVRFKDEILMRTVAERLLAQAFEGEHVLSLDGTTVERRPVERVSTVREIVSPPAFQPQKLTDNANNFQSVDDKLSVYVQKQTALSDSSSGIDSSPSSSPAVSKSEQAAGGTEGVREEDADRAIATQPDTPAHGAVPGFTSTRVSARGTDKPVQLDVFRQAMREEMRRIGGASEGMLREGRYDVPLDSRHTEIRKEEKTEVASGGAHMPEDVPAATNAATIPVGYRVIGVLFNTYILIEANDSLVMIDQHAAHERLQYEKFMAQLEAGRGSQQLLTPLIVRLSARELALIQENTEVLKDAGYDVEPFGEQDIQVRAVPFILGRAELRPAFMDTINALYRIRNATIDDRRAEVMQMACKSAVKGGDPLSEAEIASLINQMLETGAPPTCPHGRPVMKSVSRRELEKLFKRIQ